MTYGREPSEPALGIASRVRGGHATQAAEVDELVEDSGIAVLRDHGKAEELEAFLESLPDTKTTPESAAVRVTDPRLQLGLILRLLFAGALSIPFWHAPALVHWGRQNWAKSLFFSSVALWRNKGAFGLYGAAWLALWMLLLAFVSLGVGVFGPQRFTLVATPLRRIPRAVRG